ncbi:MAG: hypothetical protein QOJ07_3028 [Thermoleophilaceae bacterium]|nr:hypothetical protein [Thermoleophilaceae bacterium]
MAWRVREEQAPGQPAIAIAKENDMGDGAADKGKGRLKEAGGALTGDKSLKNEGKVDQASGNVKDKIGDASDKVKDIVNPKDR